jgi:hypothetical protein
MQEALTEALEHPLEYPTQRSRKIGKKIFKQSDVSESWLWTAIGVCASLGVLLMLRTSHEE